jgi:predicted transposase YdaD
VEELTRVFGREIMIQSSVWQAAWNEGKAQGEAKGKAEGRLAAQRELCLEFIEQHHPTLVDAARSVVEGCTDHATLREWSLKASLLDHASFARLIGVE